ncbi:MAG: cell division protein ZapA [Granulosicoccaceae bacterium]
MNKANTVKLRILDKEVQLSCAPGEEDALADAAALVDKSMRELRLRNNSSSTEKLAIVTAINTAYSLLSERSGTQGDDHLSERLQTINKKLDSLLHEDV